MKILERLYKTLQGHGDSSGRFPKVVLNVLSAAGWHEGRKWETELLNDFVTRFDNRRDGD